MCAVVPEQSDARRECDVALQCDAWVTESRPLSDLHDQAERSSTSFPSRIGGGPGIGRDCGGAASLIQEFLARSYSKNNYLNYDRRDVYDERRHGEADEVAGLRTRLLGRE